MNRRTTRPRAARWLLAAALVAPLAACTFTNEATTDRPHDVTDGVSAELGAVAAVDLLVVTGAVGDPGTVLGALTNQGGHALTVTVAAGDEPVGTVRLAAGATAYLGTTDGEQLTIPTVADPPGAVTPLSLSSAVGTTTVQVPVLDGTLPQYATLVPTPSPNS